LVIAHLLQRGLRQVNHEAVTPHSPNDSVRTAVALVVEDDPFVREMTVAGLEDAGFKVTEAASGGEALRLLQAGIAVDALLTDIRLPEANGWAVAQAYRERFPDLPVLYVTGYTEQMQPVPGGIILLKPYRMAQVISVLEAWAA
jgi:CheY-like chemotaxis protein